jgi:putative YpdA family bacillithiol system oxidoreductase
LQNLTSGMATNNPGKAIRDFFSELIKGKPEPGVARRPVLDKHFESSVKGLYIVGDLAGAPLLKTAAAQGAAVIDHIATELQANGHVEEEAYDVIIAGAGAAGLAAGLRAQERGLNYLILEQGEVANTISIFPKGKIIYGEPVAQAMPVDLWLPERSSKEELLARWSQDLEERQLNIHTGETLKEVKKNGVFTVKTDKGSYKAKRVVLAIGKFGNPRKLRVPGEDKPKVENYLRDPEQFQGKKIAIVGGGDVAAEAALSLCGHNHVTMIVLEDQFVFCNKDNIRKIHEKERQGKLTIHFEAITKEITDDGIVFEKNGTRQEIPNDHVFVMIGQELPTKFFKRIGIRLEGEWSASRWLILPLSFGLVYTVYGIKHYLWPFTLLPQEAYQLWGVSPAFWYSVVYTALMVGFGIPAMRRWGKEDRYQRYRYLSLISVQVLLLFVLPEIIYNLILHSESYWRLYGLTFAWPLFFNTFFDNPGLFFVLWGAFLAFVALPIFVRYHGKRYCTWICSCGGLAETFGDRWRHLAPKGVRSRRWEIMNVPVLIASVLITALVVLEVRSFFVDPWTLKKWYSLIADTWLVGIIAVTVYPILGGKIWCRYWCPLAKYMELISKRIGKLKITSNDKCIQCGECSRYCEVGINVMQFAKNQEEFSNKNTSCIGCGICITVCPMDVLKFGDQPETKKEEPALIQIPVSA